MLSSKFSKHANHSALHLDVTCRNHQRFHLGVGGLQADLTTGLTEEALQGSVRALKQCHHDLPVPGRSSALHEDIIAITDVIVNHRVPLYPQDEDIALAAGEVTQRKRLRVRNGLNRLSGSDTSKQRKFQ